MAVDGQIVSPGDQAEGTERITVDGKRVSLRERTAARHIIYHKPSGEVTTRADPENRPTVFDRLPRLRGARWVAVGRLDVTTTGLLLFTTDGALANALMHPRRALEREYLVRVLGEVPAKARRQLLTGVQLDDGMAKFSRLREGKGAGANRWYTVGLREGRNREVRRLFEAVDCKVSRLMRVRYGPVELPRDLRPGQHRPVDDEIAAKLYVQAGLKK